VLDIFRNGVKALLDYQNKGLLVCFILERVNKVRWGTRDWESTLKEWNSHPDTRPEWRYHSVTDMLADFRRYEEEQWGEIITALPE
jgi:hypothetical protein